jgi:hypothetical protein
MATVLNCVSARWQEEEERLPISIFWVIPCFAGDSESYNPLELREIYIYTVFLQMIFDVLGNI